MFLKSSSNEAKHLNHFSFDSCGEVSKVSLSPEENIDSSQRRVILLLIMCRKLNESAADSNRGN